MPGRFTAGLIWLLPLLLRAADLPTGAIIDDVRCPADSQQGYALYLPSG